MGSYMNIHLGIILYPKKAIITFAELKSSSIIYSGKTMNKVSFQLFNPIPFLPITFL